MSDSIGLEKLQINSTEYSYNLGYPLWHLEDVLLPLFHEHFTYDSLRETILSANHTWCAYRNGKCLACALMTDVGSQGGLYLLLFGVRRSAQGYGIGKNLLEHLLQWARNTDYKFIYLHTEHENFKAIRMYEKAGFRKEVYQPEGFDQLPNLGTDAVSMIFFFA